MLKTYIFDEIEDNWTEENFTLLKHDLCAILDDETHVIYIWRGPKSSKEKYKKALQVTNQLIGNESDFNLTINVNEQKFPTHIQEKLKLLLKTKPNEEERSKYLFSRFITIRFYFLLLLMTIILPIISIFNLGYFFNWIPIGNNYSITAENYNIWLDISSILTLITLIAFLVSIFIAIYEKEPQAITLSSIGIIICVGVLVYLQQGIFIFIFQEGSTETNYIIKSADLILVFGLISGSKAIFLIPNTVKLVSFLKKYRIFLF